ncbi:hypothetical protein QBC43DRAFT_292465 [Cladorrhinum sp. PSN259]|nr:hypothetical protein QBC43DRAFT_292465 [Cladorrhinum sp. PSN259]
MPKVKLWERFWRTYTDELEGDANGATPERMNKVNAIIRVSLSVAAVIEILVSGEMNFWSAPVSWQTETMANIGQWAPILASAFAVWFRVISRAFGTAASDTFDGLELQQGPTSEYPIVPGERQRHERDPLGILPPPPVHKSPS